MAVATSKQNMQWSILFSGAIPGVRTFKIRSEMFIVLLDALFVIVYRTEEELARELETGEYTSGFHYEFDPFHKIREYFDQAH